MPKRNELTETLVVALAPAMEAQKRKLARTVAADSPKRQRRERGDGVYTRKNRKGFWIQWYDAQGRRHIAKTHAPTLDQARRILAQKRTDAEKQRVFG
jgi:hypothetical protein